MPKIQDAGWECTGRDLIIVTMYKDVPIVLPARALDVIDPESWWDQPIERFAGGDHYHLVVPRRPGSPFKSDTTLAIGDSVLRCSYLGGLGGGGELFISAPL